MNFVISEETLQKVANYLVSRPWMEVNALIQLITSLPVEGAAAAAPAPTPAPAPEVTQAPAATTPSTGNA